MTEEIRIGDYGLPDDLRALDAELSSIRYEERPSFGPELRAELARQWIEEVGRTRPTSSLRRNLIAAGLAAVLVGGAAVPSARASFVRLLGALSADQIQTDAPEPLESAPVEASVEESAPVKTPDVQPEVAPAIAAPTVDAEPEVVPEPVIILPEMIDRARSEQLLQEAYPIQLQRRGIGGTVWLRLWVDETGVPDDVEVSRSSGVPELDQTAVQVAPRFTFAPAVQDGRRFGTWIEFPVLFEPDPTFVERSLRPVVDPLSLPTVPKAEWWELSEPLDLDALPSPAAAEAAEASGMAAAERSLAASLADGKLLETYGPAGAILEGEPPDGARPTEWRTAVGAALQSGLDSGMESSASLLALGRIRLRQGLRTEARSLFERGLQLAMADGVKVSPWTVAELHYERGTLLRDSWLAADGVGKVDADAFSGESCAPARSSGGGGGGYASVDRLIAWNYLCPTELADVFSRGFERSNGGSGDLTLMMASYRAAVEAYPAHVEANTDLLVTLAARNRWEDVLSGARRFTRVSGGHPNGLLLAGLALDRLGDVEAASAHFEAALARLPEPVAEQLRDVGYLLSTAERAEYRRIPVGERRSWERGYWAARDRTPSTPINERRVEHLARTSFAYLRYGTTFGDAAEVWIRFGEPTNVHIVDQGSGRLAEFWDYGSGPDITFVRWVSSKRTDLTPEGRAYVDDLGKIFPPQ